MDKDIVRLAREYGFADARVIPFSEAAALFSGRAGYESAVVLFFPYAPLLPAGTGSAALSNYYPASNKAYHQAKKLAEEAGLEHVTAVDLKALAAKTGGFIGKNSLYYHETLGSFVTIQALLSREKLPERWGEGMEGCGDCERCLPACPMDALKKGVGEHCLRARMGKNPPDPRARPKVTRLLGCELCQEVCPKNAHIQKAAGHAYPLADILGKKVLGEIQELCGKNMARTNVLLAQAACIAANQGKKELAPILEKLAEEPLLTEVSNWALDKLKTFGYNDKTPY